MLREHDHIYNYRVFTGKNNYIYIFTIVSSVVLQIFRPLGENSLSYALSSTSPSLHVPAPDALSQLHCLQQPYKAVNNHRSMPRGENIPNG